MSGIIGVVSVPGLGILMCQLQGHTPSADPIRAQPTWQPWRDLGRLPQPPGSRKTIFIPQLWLPMGGRQLLRLAFCLRL